jgi:dihydrofolate reductase
MIHEKQISIIVAVAENNAIGKDNKLLWHISDDLKRFKKLTSENTVVMGKNTYFSLPVRPLPGRKNIVITDIPDESFDGCLSAHSFEEAICLMDNDKENFIMGGASIYRQFFNIAQKLYLTRVYKSFEGDTFFPEIADSQWQLLEKSEVFTDEKSGLRFSYIIYQKTEK